MAATVGESGASEFRIGSALRVTIKTLARNIVPFGILALIFNAPMQLLPFWFGGAAMTGGDADSVVIDMAENIPLFATITFGTVLGQILLGFLLSATLVYGTIMDLRGGRAGVLECISRGFGLLLPVIGVGILQTIIIFIGMILLFIPGVIAVVVLWVAIPAAVVERPGILASLSRSTDLTKGNRWRVFGLILVLSLISFGIGLVVSLVGGIIGFGGLLATGSVAFASATLAINMIFQSFYTALFAVASAVVYHDLRIAKEGADVEQIAAVFD